MQIYKERWGSSLKSLENAAENGATPLNEQCFQHKLQNRQRWNLAITKKTDNLIKGNMALILTKSLSFPRHPYLILSHSSRTMQSTLPLLEASSPPLRSLLLDSHPQHLLIAHMAVEHGPRPYFPSLASSCLDNTFGRPPDHLGQLWHAY